MPDDKYYGRTALDAQTSGQHPVNDHENTALAAPTPEQFRAKAFDREQRDVRNAVVDLKKGDTRSLQAEIKDIVRAQETLNGTPAPVSLGSKKRDSAAHVAQNRDSIEQGLINDAAKALARNDMATFKTDMAAIASVEGALHVADGTAVTPHPVDKNSVGPGPRGR
jgi:hypothetical protein